MNLSKLTGVISCIDNHNSSRYFVNIYNKVPFLNISWHMLTNMENMLCIY